MKLKFWHKTPLPAIPPTEFVDEKQLAAAAEKLAKVFTYWQLKNEYPECVGYLAELVGSENAKLFLLNYVLERACKIIKTVWTPELIKKVDSDILQKYYVIPVELLDEVVLNDYPLQPFKKIVFYSPTPVLSDAILIIKNDTIVYEGYELHATRGICDEILLGFVLPNVPFILISYSPRIAQPLADIKKHIEFAVDGFKDVFTRFIVDQNEQVNDYKYMLIETESKMKRESKKAEDYKADKEFLEMQGELVMGEQDETKTTIPKVLYYILLGLSSLSLVLLAYVMK